MKYLRPRPEGHLPADMSVDFFLGLAFAVMINGRVNERKLEEMLCMPRGTLAGIERGLVELDKPTCVFLRLLHRLTRTKRTESHYDIIKATYVTID